MRPDLSWPPEVPSCEPPYEIEVDVVMQYRPRKTIIRLPGIGRGKIQMMRLKNDGNWYCRTIFSVPNVQQAIAQLDYRFQFSSASIH